MAGCGPSGHGADQCSLPAPPALNHPIFQAHRFCLQGGPAKFWQAKDNEHSPLGPTCDMRAHHILTQAFSILEGAGVAVFQRGHALKHPRRQKQPADMNPQPRAPDAAPQAALGPFPIWSQSVIPCPVLTVASCPSYRFLRRQVRWSGIPIS